MHPMKMRKTPEIKSKHENMLQNEKKKRKKIRRWMKHGEQFKINISYHSHFHCHCHCHRHHHKPTYACDEHVPYPENINWFWVEPIKGISKFNEIKKNQNKHQTKIIATNYGHGHGHRRLTEKNSWNNISNMRKARKRTIPWKRIFAKHEKKKQKL